MGDASNEIVAHVASLIEAVTLARVEAGANIFEFDEPSWMALAQAAGLDIKTLPPETGRFLAAFLAHSMSRISAESLDKASPLFGTAIPQPLSPAVFQISTFGTTSTPIGSGLAEVLRDVSVLYRQLDRRIFTPHVLLHLLRKSDVARLVFDVAQDGLAGILVGRLHAYVLDDSHVRPFVEFEWRSRKELKIADNIARSRGSRELGILHVVLGLILNDASSARQLRIELGELRVDIITRFALGEISLESRATPTPGINLFGLE